MHGSSQSHTLEAAKHILASEAQAAADPQAVTVKVASVWKMLQVIHLKAVVVATPAQFLYIPSKV